jgi:protein phosphatase
MPFTIRHACRSDRGRTHEHNEDRWFADAATGLYFVADGMADARPAQCTVERLPMLLRHHLTGIEDPTSPSAETAIQAALEELNEEVRTMDSGTTLVLALVCPPRARIVHLGDSRIYLWREGHLDRLTRDHSLVEEMVDRGVLSVEEAARSRGNGGPTRFIGMWDDPVADMRTLELASGDRLLLCSDGLNYMLPDARIAAVLRENPAPDVACRQLIDAANTAGGEDNITALIVGATSL